MGCRVSRANEEAVVKVSVKKETEVKKTEEGIPHQNEEVSEYSLRECSLIPHQVEPNKKRVSEDPSIYAMIEDLQ